MARKDAQKKPAAAEASPPLLSPRREARRKANQAPAAQPLSLPTALRAAVIAAAAAAAFGGVRYFSEHAADAAAAPAQSGRKQDPLFPVVSGYVPEYRLDHVRDHIAAYAKGVNEIILFSVQPGADGSISHEPGIAEDRLGFAAAAKRAGVQRVLLSIGGAGRSMLYKSATKTAKRRATLIQAALALCEKYSLDGVDIDWEMPRDAEEEAARVRLLAEMQSAFEPSNLYLTVALHYWETKPAPELFAAVDRINFMTYDFHGDEHHSRKATETAIKALMHAGCPAAKIALGVPAYARDRKGDAKTYSEIVGAAGPEAKRLKSYAFNGLPEVRKKARWAAKNGLAGVFVWELGQDSFEEGLSLVRAMRQALRSND